MPISLTLTDGVIPADKTALAVSKITESFLRHHGLGGNKVMTPNVTAHLNILPKGHTFAAGLPVEGAWIETKTPSFALADHDIQAAFFGEATQILHDLSGGSRQGPHLVERRPRRRRHVESRWEGHDQRRAWAGRGRRLTN
ncbi:4-oxalocrotonate tautomerase [Pannonibacter sp. Pt2-lr]